MRDHTSLLSGLVRHAAFERSLTRADLVDWYRRTRERSRALFEIPIADAYYDRPIPLRNPIVFYEGHLPAFAVNTLVKLAQKREGIDARLEALFERGIDPEDETAVRDPAETWPSRSEVHDYAAAADALVENALSNLSDEAVEVEAAGTILEHELMHQETFIYMLHHMPYDRKVAPGDTFGAPVSSPARSFVPPAPESAGENTGAPKAIRVPAGPATLGADGTVFGWDNEFPEHVVRIDSFEIDRFKVTNGDYLSFLEATGAPTPHFWIRREGEWFWRGMFEAIPLPLEWPVYVTHDEAESYARWRGMRLPTEAEYHRAAFGTPSGRERQFPWGDQRPQPSLGNFDFHSWEPQPVGSYSAGASAWGVHDLVGNGWEWTSTLFDGFAGFRPMKTYPRYSADFFDRQHYVIKGASPATARELIRRSFRNWFRPNYPYVFATFRCVR